jgi:NAD-dependent deacetylase
LFSMSRVGQSIEFLPMDLSPSDRVFVLTGAGISAESGIATFRDAGGLWERNRVEDVASPEGWRRDPKLVWRFYSLRREQAKTVQPNAAHEALAALERSIGDRLFLCTQNVDPLHERGGSMNVVHMHGELMKSRCSDCDRPPFDDDKGYLDALPKCDRCGGAIRPHICWFGEVPFDMDLIARRLERSTVFVTIGSSGAVYPAAGFVRAARSLGQRTVYVGPEEPENASAFDECRLGKATVVVPSLFAVR